MYTIQLWSSCSRPNVNLTVSDNYRGITLSSIFGKVLDLIKDYLIVFGNLAAYQTILLYFLFVMFFKLSV